MTIYTMVQNVDDVIRRRIMAKAEIDKLKAIVSACDQEIANALDADYDEFTEWVREVRGEVKDIENRKIHWSDGKDNYVIYRRKGSEPRKSINPVKLLAQGVAAHVIKNATDYGQPGKPGIAVRKVIGEVEDDSE